MPTSVAAANSGLPWGISSTWGIGAIRWHSKKQKITALSTVDAEFIASAAAVQEMLWFRELLSRLLMTDVLPPTVLYNDNAASLASFFDDEY